MGTIKTDNITGRLGSTASAPITLSGDTATFADINMSTGKSIKNAAGTALLSEAGVLGSGVTFPAGHIINVESGIKTNIQSTNQDYASGWTDASDLSVSWTPSAATNYVWLSANVQMSQSSASYAAAWRYYVSGGGTAGSVGVGVPAVSTIAATAGGPTATDTHAMFTFSGSVRFRLNATIPNWSSGALTIKIQFGANTGGYARINEAGNQATVSTYTTTASTITAFEIQG